MPSFSLNLGGNLPDTTTLTFLHAHKTTMWMVPRCVIKLRSSQAFFLHGCRVQCLWTKFWRKTSLGCHHSGTWYFSFQSKVFETDKSGVLLLLVIPSGHLFYSPVGGNLFLLSSQGLFCCIFAIHSFIGVSFLAKTHYVLSHSAAGLFPLHFQYRFD